MKPLKAMLNLVMDTISLQELDYEMNCVDLPDDYICSEIGYCGHLAFPYAHIQLYQATKLIPSNFQ